MDIRHRIVTRLPLQELWNDQGSWSQHRIRDLSLSDLQARLSSGTVQFVVVDVGHRPQWLSKKECYHLWKSTIRPHLAEPTSKVFLEDFPGEYFYRASEWLFDSESIVVLEKQH